MDNPKGKNVSPQDDQIGEEEANNETEDELEERLLEEFNIDPDDEPELFEKILERERKHKENLSKAIEQKIKWRERAKSRGNKEKNSPKGKSQSITKKGTPEDVESLIEQKLQERLDQQELKSLNLPDQLKGEVQDLAKLKGISVREAAEHKYIQTLKEEHEREQRVKKATPKRSKRGAYKVKVDPSKPLNPEDYDLDTEEGVEAWKEAKRMRDEYMQKQEE